MSTTICPECFRLLEVSRSLFLADLRCPKCDAPLSVSKLYTRSLVFIAVLIGYSTAWAAGSLGPRAVCFFNIPWLFFVLGFHSGPLPS